MSRRKLALALALALIPVLSWLGQILLGLAGCHNAVTTWGGALAVVAVIAGTTAIYVNANGDGSLTFLTNAALYLGTLFTAGAILAWVAMSSAPC